MSVKKTTEGGEERPRNGRTRGSQTESLENFLDRATLGGHRARPGPISKRIAQDLLSGRLAYDPERRESWIVVSAAARPTRKYRRAKLIGAAVPDIDVIGLHTDPASVEQAQVSFYAAIAASEVLFRAAQSVLESIREKDPEVWAKVLREIARAKLDKDRSLTSYPIDHPYHR